MDCTITLKASYQGPIDRDLDNKVAEIIAAKYDGSGIDFGTQVRDHFWFELSLDELTEAVRELVGLNKKFEFYIRT